MINRVYIFILLIVMILISSCNKENPTVPEFDYEPEINVFGLFILNNNQKTIRIEQTYKVTDYYPSFRGIEDATVFVSTESQRVEFVHLFEGRYSDEHDVLQLTPGETYKLDITMSDGRKVSAQCIMPDKPKILQPVNGGTAEAFTPLTVEYEQAEFADRYQISLTNDFGGIDFYELSAEGEEELYGFIFAKPDRYIIKVASLDKNYYDHLRSRSDREPLLNINGAVGVFGALAYDTVRFTAF